LVQSCVVLTGRWQDPDFKETVINNTGNVNINVIFRLFRVTTLAVEKQQLLKILSVCP